MRQEAESAEHASNDEIFAHLAVSFWLKAALQSALLRDPVDAANDADVLARVLNDRAVSCLKKPINLDIAGPVN